jgi:outer membrane protein assembly factor BamB
MNARSLAIVAIGLFGYSVAALALDWPQWRGPERTGISQEKGLLKEWPAGGPKLVWQVKELGDGFSTPAVVGDRIYLLANKGNDNEFALALNAANGQALWTAKLGKVGPNGNPSYPGARSTPTVDGALLFVLSSDGDLACIEAADGKVRWQKSLRTDFGGKPGKWAYAESPLIDGDALVCTPGGSEATIVALKKQTGEPIWKSAVPGGDAAGFASVVVGEVGGIKQYIQFLGSGLVGVEAKTGRFLWRYDHTSQGQMNIPTPIFHKDAVFSTATKTGSGLAKLAAEGDKVTATEVYFTPKLQNHIGGAVLIGDHLYSTTSQALVCMDFATGSIKWEERGVGKGSLCAAENLLYVHGENGEMALVEASPEAYHEKGRFAPPDQPNRGSAKAWTYPVIANGRLYIRDLGTMWCYDVADSKAAK